MPGPGHDGNRCVNGATNRQLLKGAPVIIAVLSNFLALPFYPVGLAVFCIAAALVAMLCRRRGMALVLVLVAGVELYLFSSDPFSHWLVRSLEKRYAPVAVFPTGATIVLLTGGEVPRMPPRLYDEVGQAGNRVLYAARLFKQGVATRILVTGGNLSFLRTIEGSEAEADGRLLTGLFGIDSSRILLEKKARNTYENAVFTRKMLDSLRLPRTVILVTSAMHMPRSVAVFRKAGLSVVPAPTDFRADEPIHMKLIYILPNVEALGNSTAALHEWYGIAAYKVMGRW